MAWPRDSAANQAPVKEGGEHPFVMTAMSDSITKMRLGTVPHRRRTDSDGVPWIAGVHDLMLVSLTVQVSHLIASMNLQYAKRLTGAIDVAER